MPTQEGRVTKPKPRQSQTPRRVPASPKILPLVERTNALSIKDFISTYVYPQNQSTTDAQSTQDANPDTSSSSNASTPVDVYSASTIPTTDLEACLDLVELTSSEAYAASGAGWSRPKKRKEMKLPDMKYLIVRAGLPADRGDEPKIGDEVQSGDEPGKVLGFLSFMVTYEDGAEVIYCYEIHLAPEARGRGLGGLLMGRMEEVGRRVGLTKAMLTVFRSNVVACEFYAKGGYVIDEYSPPPRKLRNGTIKEYDYMILSKRLK